MVNKSVSFGILAFFVFGASFLVLSGNGFFTGNAISSGESIIINFPAKIGINLGGTTNLSVNVINFGEGTLQNCKFIFTGDKPYFISSTDIENLNSGEKQDYSIYIDTGDLSEGIYSVDYIFSCNQGSLNGKSYIDISKRSFNFDVEKTELNGNKIFAYYNLNQSEGFEQRVIISYELQDSTGKKISGGREEVVLGNVGNYEGILSIDFPNEKDMNIFVKADNGKDSVYVSKSVSSPKSVTGFSVYEGNGGGSPIFIIAFSMTLLLVTFIFLRRIGLRKAVSQRQFIKLNLGSNGNL